MHEYPTIENPVLREIIEEKSRTCLAFCKDQLQASLANHREHQETVSMKDGYWLPVIKFWRKRVADLEKSPTVKAASSEPTQ